jgi:spermidine/putrescine-binding protein
VGSKKLIVTITGFLLFVGLVFFYQPKSSLKVLKVCTWSNYLPEDLLKEFSEQTGIRLELNFISGNEELFAKFKAGATDFDVIQPSDYMVRQMNRLGMLARLDHRLLTNIQHLDPFFGQLNYDPGHTVSVPFSWGTTGITLNTKHIKPDAGGVSWKMLFQSPDPKHTSLLDDMREVFVGVLYFLHLPTDLKKTQFFETAQRQIAHTKKNVLLFSSEPQALLLKEEIWIAHSWSVDGIQTHYKNPDINYFIPIEGGVLWVDNFAIPAKSAKVSEAHTFINFFMDPKNALRTARDSHLATPNKTARAELPKDQLENPSFYPPEEMMKKLLLFDDISETMPLLNKLWTEIKT